MIDFFDYLFTFVYIVFCSSHRLPLKRKNDNACETVLLGHSLLAAYRIIRHLMIKCNVKRIETHHLLHADQLRNQVVAVTRSGAERHLPPTIDTMVWDKNLVYGLAK